MAHLNHALIDLSTYEGFQAAINRVRDRVAGDRSLSSHSATYPLIEDAAHHNHQRAANRGYARPVGERAYATVEEEEEEDWEEVEHWEEEEDRRSRQRTLGNLYARVRRALAPGAGTSTDTREAYFPRGGSREEGEDEMYWEEEEEEEFWEEEEDEEERPRRRVVGRLYARLRRALAPAGGASNQIPESGFSDDGAQAGLDEEDWEEEEEDECPIVGRSYARARSRTRRA